MQWQGVPSEDSDLEESVSTSNDLHSVPFVEFEKHVLNGDCIG